VEKICKVCGQNNNVSNFFLPDCNRNNDDMSYQSLPKIPITFFTPIFFQSETRHIVSHYSSLMETVNSFQNPSFFKNTT
jgi:hypothetical protein